MDIKQELENLQKSIISIGSISNSLCSTDKKYININKILDNLEQKLEDFKAIICVSEKRKSLYEEYNKAFNLFTTLKINIENIDKKNINKSSNNNTEKTIVNEKTNNNDNIKHRYYANDGSRIQIDKLNDEYDEYNYNITNPPPIINKYKISRAGTLTDLTERYLITQEIFSYHNQDRMERDEEYRKYVVNELLSNKNINEAIENYGGNVSDSLKRNYLYIDEYTKILAKKQLEMSTNFKRESDEGRICLLPVGTIKWIMNDQNKEVTQYKYSSFDSNMNISTGLIYGDINFELMENNEKYKKTVLDVLQHEQLYSGKYIGSIDRDSVIKQDYIIKVMLNDLGMLNNEKEFQGIEI